MSKQYAVFMDCETDYDGAKTVLFGAPFDGTVSYRPGTRFGPGAIRAESFGIEGYSPYRQKELSDCLVFDGGDLDLPFGNARRALDMIGEFTNKVAIDGKIPVMLGGEHLVTLGCVEVFAKKYKDLCILHFDAHADLRNEYMGEELSHASVIRRCHDLVGDGRIFQFGIRSMTKDEDEFAKEHTVQVKYTLDGIEQALKEIGERPLYVTIDLDVLDPSVFSGTGTPEPGGVTFKELMWAIHKLSGMNIIGADINELSPHYDVSGVSTMCACKTVRELIMAIDR